MGSLESVTGAWVDAPQGGSSCVISAPSRTKYLRPEYVPQEGEWG
jgi:hypothetical protein